MLNFKVDFAFLFWKLCVWVASHPPSQLAGVLFPVDSDFICFCLIAHDLLGAALRKMFIFSIGTTTAAMTM